MTHHDESTEFDVTELLRVNEQLSELKDLDSILDRILTEARRFTNADAGTIYLVKDNKLHFSYVHNDTTMPEDVQRQLFQRSFTTKGGLGRGIGTYSVRLFVERYLGGRVHFVSCEPEGTTFTVTLPRERSSAALNA